MAIHLKDNSSTILAKIEKCKNATLKAIGIQGQAYATLLCTVDTGRLRNSITWVTSEGQGAANTQPAAKSGGTAKPSDYAPNGAANPDTVHIGTNVEYASYIEEGTRNQTAQPFLRPAISDHIDDWYKIAQMEFSKL